jgi:hypothetical protein
VGPRNHSGEADRLGRLRRTAAAYQERYGSLPGMAAASDTETTIAARRRRLERLQREEAEIRAAIAATRVEIERLGRWVAFCLADAIERAQRDHAEGWSPRPVLGFRIWRVADDALYGARLAWTRPTMTATCLRHQGDEEIPHSDGRCGRLGCGVYVAKQIEPLLVEFAVPETEDFALGLVALRGKVVEHERGYRGAAADVVAIAAVRGERWLATAVPEEITKIFARPSTIRSGERCLERARLVEQMSTYIAAQARKAGQWTLEISNG